MATFNLADLFEIVADAVGDRLALVAGDVRLTYAQLDERATRAGRHLLDAGACEGEHVAVLARNRAEWLETMLGALKARLVPINVNWRYTDDELLHVLDDADAVALVCEASFASAAFRVSSQLPRLRHVVVIGGDAPNGSAISYENALAAAAPSRTFAPRAGDDRYVLYTGGTTGMPKGVVWRSEDLFFAALSGGNPGGAPITTPEALRNVLSSDREPWLVTSPLMHAFPVAADGTRWAVPGDLAVHEADGSIRLLGRGSSCINTGGEKVFPEEVEAALKGHPDVADAFVVGLPDPRFGQAVAAVVTTRADTIVTLEALRDALRGRLAGYKAPRHLVVVDELRYTPQGKPDYRWARDRAAREEQPA